MRHPARPRDRYFYGRETDAEISMDQFAKTLLPVNPPQLIKPRSPPIGQHPVVRAYDTRKKTETQYPLTVVVFKTFVIDEGDLFFQDRMEHPLIVRLLFAGMREEKIGLVRNEIRFRHFFNTQQN